MNTLKFRLDNLKSQNMLTTLVSILTLSVLVFSNYLSASFWKQLGNTNVACLTFAMLGVFLELAKICAGQAVISSYGLNNRTLKIIAITVLSIFTITSFVASVGTIAHEFKMGKETNVNSNKEVISINNSIAMQEQVIANLLQSQHADTIHGYRSRANATLLLIKQAQIDLENLQNKLSNTKIMHNTVSNVVIIFNSLISLGQDQWEIVLIVILGALAEISSLFLLYLNSALKNTSDENAIFMPVFEDLHIVRSKGSSKKLPISVSEYKIITRKLIQGKLSPTQRELKKEVRLGNENIAKIFARWVSDGVLIKTGRSYKMAA